MTNKVQSINDLLKIKEEQFYRRLHKKIYLGRILKSTDLQYALNQYEKGFAFDVEFPVGINDNFKECMTYFEENEKLGHSMDRALRIRSKGNINEVETNIANEKKNKDNSTSGVVYFEKEEVQFRDSDQDFKSNIWNLVQHFSEIPDDVLIAEYAQWKAKKRFLALLRTELLQFKSIENEITEKALPEIPETYTLEPETSEMSNTSNEQGDSYKLTIEDYKTLSKELIEEAINSKVHPSNPVLQSKTSDLEHFTIAQLAAFLCCTKQSIHNYKKAGLPHYRIGRKVLFEKKKVLEFMKTIKSR